MWKPTKIVHARTAVLVFVSLALLTGCATAFIAIGVTVVGVGAAALAFQCDEPVSVSVWDPAASHPICDAEVTATREGTRIPFSPCYAAELGEGSWTVTATKPGFEPATGTIIVERDHRCSEPIYHSLELTLRGGPPAPMYGPPPGAWVPGAPVPAAPTPPPAAWPPKGASPVSPAPPNATAVPPAATPSAPFTPPEPTAPPSSTTAPPKASFPTAAPGPSPTR